MHTGGREVSQIPPASFLLGSMKKQAFIITGLGFGDEGKGTMTDFIARREGAHTVIRHNGGGQAAHNVIDANGRHHTFAQFGAASFVPGLRTYLSRYMLLDPIALLEEGAALQRLGLSDIFRRLTVDPRAMVVTPYHMAANQLREIARGNAIHGSCGKGIGETMADSLEPGADMLLAGDLKDPATTRRKLQFFQEKKRTEMAQLIFQNNDSATRDLVAQRLWLLESPQMLENILQTFGNLTRTVLIEDAFATIAAAPGTILFEASQGILLDEWHGFHPYTTWSTTTSANAQTLLREAGYDGAVSRVGVLRAYHTRHGAGPFPTEDAALTQKLPDVHNVMGQWQKGFRVGAFDAVLARYAIEANGGIDCLAITNIDRLQSLLKWRIADAYDLSVVREKAACFHNPSRIRVVKGPNNLHYQEVLGRELGRVTPLYQEFTNQVDAGRTLNMFLRSIEQATGARIRYLSRGASSADKLELADTNGAWSIVQKAA